MPIIRPAGCASELPGPGCAVDDCTPSAPSAPREGWEDGTPPPHRDFKERSVVLAVAHPNPWASASSYLSSQSLADSRCNLHATSRSPPSRRSLSCRFILWRRVLSRSRVMSFRLAISVRLTPLNGYRNGVPGRAISRRPNCASVRSPHTPCCPRVVLALYWAHTEAVGSHHVPFKFSATELRSALCTSSWDAVSSFDPRRSSHVGAAVRSAVIAVARY